MNKPGMTLLFFILLGIAFYVMWFVELKPDQDQEHGAGDQAPLTIGPIYPLGPMEVELAGKYLNVIHNDEGKPPKLGTKKKFLKIDLDLELKGKDALATIEKRIDQVKAAVVEAVSSKKVKDIQSAGGKESLTEEILNRLNNILPENSVSNVHYKEFVIQ